jgi:hypothetical protein
MANAITCNKSFPGSGLVALLGNDYPTDSSGSNWSTGFDTLYDVLDFYADHGHVVTLGTNIRLKLRLVITTHM